MQIRETREQDQARIREVVEAAFADEPIVADLVEELRRTGRARHELVAVEQDAVIGHVLLSRGWVDDERELAEVLVLSPLGVLPDRQGREIGSALVRAALESARSAGESLVFLEGDPSYYGARGFQRADRLGFLAPSPRIPAPACQVAVLADTGHRGRLVYADAFWSLDCVGLRGETLAQVRQSLGE